MRKIAIPTNSLALTWRPRPAVREAVMVLHAICGIGWVEFVSIVSTIVVLMAVIYLGAAVLDRRRAAWEAFLVGFVVLTAGRLLNSSVGPAVVFMVSALVSWRWELSAGNGVNLAACHCRPSACLGSVRSHYSRST
jgi:hypothetical protein